MADLLSRDLHHIPPSSIIIDRDSRQRRKIDVSDLLDSIRARGVLQPIIVRDGSLQLVAGERRLTACLELGLETIPCRFTSELDQTELQIIELQENIKRSDLEWQDLVTTYGTIHTLFLSRDRDWTMQESAQQCGINLSTMSVALRVFTALGEERIRKASGMREAYNMLGRRDERAAAEAMNELLEYEPPSAKRTEEPASEGTQGRVTAIGGGATVIPMVSPAPVGRPSTPPESILEETFLHWAPKYSGKKFNFIHCDFPYGIDVFAGPQAGGLERVYDDSQNVYFRLLDALVDNLDRLLGVSGHLMFWFSERHRAKTLAIFAERAPYMVFYQHPLIWLKSDNAGIAADSQRHPRHVYETALLASKGARKLVATKADAYSAPTDRKLHPSAKPEPMLRHFFEMLVDQSTELLDPTCGSGSALRAAESIGAARILGMDSDPDTVGRARQALRQSRALRGGL